MTRESNRYAQHSKLWHPFKPRLIYNPHLYLRHGGSINYYYRLGNLNQ